MPMRKYTMGECAIYNEDYVRDLVSYAMEKRHMSMHRLSDLSGVSDSTISTWLRGDHSIRYDKLEQLVACLDERFYDE